MSQISPTLDPIRYSETADYRAAHPQPPAVDFDGVCADIGVRPKIIRDVIDQQNPATWNGMCNAVRDALKGRGTFDAGDVARVAGAYVAGRSAMRRAA